MGAQAKPIPKKVLNIPAALLFRKESFFEEIFSYDKLMNSEMNETNVKLEHSPSRAIPTITVHTFCGKKR